MIIIFYIMLIIGLFATGKKSIKALRAGDSKEAMKWGLFSVGIVLLWLAIAVILRLLDKSVGATTTSKVDTDSDVYKQINATLGKDVNIFFKNNYTLKYDNGEIRKGEPNASVMGKLEFMPDRNNALKLTSPLYLDTTSILRTEYSSVEIYISDIESVSVVPIV